MSSSSATKKTSTPVAHWGRHFSELFRPSLRLERDLIRERASAGLRNAKLKGKTLGRPPLTLDRDRITRLRASGASIRESSAQLEVSTATVARSRNFLLQ
jgi:hypothetical protein